MEEPKRLTPEKDTLRELYLKSGNQCAFPKCQNVIMDEDGDYVGEVCHIEAAMPGGERFNPDQTNEERRSFDNLMLLCQIHHTKTNDVEKFPVGRLKMIKYQHEDRYTSAVDKIFNSITDKTKEIKVAPPAKLSKISKSLSWNLKEDELEETAKDIQEYLDVLSKVPENSRRVYTIMIERHEKNFFDNVINPEELEEVTQTRAEKLKKHIRILEKYDLTTDYYLNMDEKPEVEIKDFNDWDIPIQLFEFCKKEEIELSELLVNLNFKLLG
ncbi:hypothetical protein [Fodinibius sp. Rm-B-1B1-1]|uniref:hypothetical protein n=1 Tax=Fodinibius alkaliphilus TaxID=3140241 RepID=UPI00315AF9F4